MFKTLCENREKKIITLVLLPQRSKQTKVGQTTPFIHSFIHLFAQDVSPRKLQAN